MAIAVFLVEDNQTIRDNLIPALADLGCATVIATAESEDEAIDWLAVHKSEWDLAVVDFFLKQGTGLGVVEWCNGRDAEQRVVVLTNYSTQATRIAFKNAGADRVFETSPMSWMISSSTACDCFEEIKPPVWAQSCLSSSTAEQHAVELSFGDRAANRRPDRSRCRPVVGLSDDL
ncbi:response regulator [Variovorax ginsengisoli]|uniref:Response regulator n=1 Tax=Variovorax ginsengisoli TaxID=363844 RepID=A0ABT8SBN8_9BURK|nr:response regulator [Variovorax ginsengisoli]MDN8617165.1 response regulator [Variovorax ginsengisoli]MDO1536335.1 response regulator [Variovorax ginsengisoli]